jgi:hypothetical protein
MTLFFCAPGVEGAHEKGGVEGEIGRFRRRHLTPMPYVGSLEVLNAAPAADARDDARHISGRVETIGVAAARELRLLTPLPAEPFDVSLRLSCRVDAKARICVRQSYYSVPARYLGRPLEVRLGATSLTVYDGARIVAICFVADCHRVTFRILFQRSDRQHIPFRRTSTQFPDQMFHTDP